MKYILLISKVRTSVFSKKKRKIFKYSHMHTNTYNVHVFMRLDNFKLSLRFIHNLKNTDILCKQLLCRNTIFVRFSIDSERLHKTIPDLSFIRPFVDKYTDHCKRPAATLLFCYVNLKKILYYIVLMK